MKKLVNVLMLSVWMGVTLFSCTGQVPKADLKTDIDSLSYAIGLLHATRVEQVFMQSNLDEKYKSDFIQGFKEGFAVDAKNQKVIAALIGKVFGMELSTQWMPGFNQNLFGDTIQTLNRKNFFAGYAGAVISDSTTLMTREAANSYYQTASELIRKTSLEKRYADVKKENEEWLEKNKGNEGVITLESGLQYKVITEGKGPKPVETDVVRVHYKGTNIKGEEFEENETQFPLNGVIRGWTEGIQLMPVGSKYILYIPADLAYGEHERSEQIQPFSTLIFEVELLEIMPPRK